MINRRYLLLTADSLQTHPLARKRCSQSGRGLRACKLWAVLTLLGSNFGCNTPHSTDPGQQVVPPPTQSQRSAQPTPPPEILKPPSDSLPTKAPLEQAQEEYVNGNYKKAIELATAAQNVNPNRAWRIMGAAACSIPDLGLANAALSHLDQAGQQFVIYICQRFSITFSHESSSFSKR